MCYAYLYDVHSRSDLENRELFTSGWTLQEILAPKYVIFFSATWEQLGVRGPKLEYPIGYQKPHDLVDQIASITKIPTEALEVFFPHRYSVAQRMSCMADRRTTHEEDLAYCLLGIFEVNMPMLYGEGNAAFQRLQEEVVRQSNDLSLFTWNGAPCPKNDIATF